MGSVADAWERVHAETAEAMPDVPVITPDTATQASKVACAGINARLGIDSDELDDQIRAEIPRFLRAASLGGDTGLVGASLEFAFYAGATWREEQEGSR